MIISSKLALAALASITTLGGAAVISDMNNPALYLSDSITPADMKFKTSTTVRTIIECGSVYSGAVVVRQYKRKTEYTDEGHFVRVTDTGVPCGISAIKPVKSKQTTNFLPESMAQEVWKPGMMVLFCKESGTLIAYQPAGTKYDDGKSSCISDSGALKNSLLRNG